ncbi:AAA family ATPase [Methylomicrobium lacus]|uniref:winged helix-turn-helix domain-containing protein n=1 Tax=Methylomicrobium lacus TaxID=136992 RepID=UPI0035A821DA
MEQNVIYAFGPFRLETKTQILCHEGESIRLQPKVYRLLLYFLRHPGRLIAREELFDGVWRGSVVEDASLRQAVNALRKALLDDSKTPRYILTVCKRGYRFLPDVAVAYASEDKVSTVQTKGLPYQSKTEYSDTAWQYDAALEQLLEAFEQAADGNRRLIFLNGDRGIGKTALLERFLAKISHSDLTMLRARCVQLGGAAEPFLPLLEALERRCQEPSGKRLIESLHRVAPTWLYQMLNMLEPEEIAALQPKVSQLSTGRMLRERADFFEKLGNDQPLILILDNSHWSDEFTLDLLNFLVSRCSPTRLLMILSFRSSENCAGTRRLEEMREELRHRGLCRELSLQRLQ